MSKEISRTHIVLIRQSIAESIISDVGTVSSAVILIGTGVVLGSSAMQWFGAILAFMLIVTRASNSRSIHRVTIAEARALLDKIEAGKP